MAQRIFDGVFEIGRELATKNLTPGTALFEEQLIKEGKEEFRVWDPKRSKIAAAIRKKLRAFPIKPGSTILYLGAANGYTASFLSDIVSERGVIFAVEFSPRAMRDLLAAAERRKNIVPILEDARLPENFAPRIFQADVVFADLAQRDQAEILIRNARAFLKTDGWAMIAIKARSIDVTAPPRKVYQEQRKILERAFEVEQMLELQPFQADHAFFLLRPRKA